MGSSAQDDQQDEIKKFLDARYVSAPEACWRAMSFPMYKEYPSTQRLDIPLENDRRVYFNENESSDQALNRTLPETTLTAWVKYNLEIPEDSETKQTLYPDFCEKHVFHKQQNPRVWKPRRSGFGGAIDRVYAVSLKDIEKYHLRILLYRIPGATSFTYMRTYNGRVYPSYQATTRAMGLLQDDNEWNATMTKASTTMSPQKIRQLFCILLSFCDVSDPFQLWLNHRLHLAGDYLYRRQQKTKVLRVGSPIMIFRNLDPSAGLCNGIRLIVKSLGVRIIEATIATGPKTGDIVYVPRIKFITEANCRNPFDFSRTQFPVRLAFAMTINKSQGQTLSNVGLYLSSHVFSHGQLYVAISKVSKPSSIRIMVDHDISVLENLPGRYTHNIQ